MAEMLAPALVDEDPAVFRLYAPDELRRDGYPQAWHDTIKHEVRERAGHRCVRCGHPYRNGEHGNGEWSPCDEHCVDHSPARAWRKDGSVFVALEVGITYQQARALYPERATQLQAPWRILTVHHLDGDKANCRWWNAVALCQRCHLTIQGKVKMERAFILEHSAWFVPYVCGWYAFKYLDQEISRSEALARQEELLALERLC